MSRATKVQDMSAEERKAKMNEERQFIQSFMEAALSGDAEKVEKLALEYSGKQKVSLFEVHKNLKDGSKRTAIHFACSSSPAEKSEENNDDIVMKLLQNPKLQPSEIETLLFVQDEDGFTPLMHACNKLHERSYERIKFLVEVGGSKLLHVKSNAGAMALHYAAGAGARKEIINCLNKNGKDAVSTLSTKIGSPLHWASGVPAAKNFSETIKTLLEDCSADVNVLNKGGISPLIMAAASGNDTHAKILVENGADRGFILGGNMTVFHVAADLNLYNTMEELLKEDASVESLETTSKCMKMENDRGETPLDLAVLGGHVECVKLIKGLSDTNEARIFMEDAKKHLEEKKKNASTTKDDNENKASKDNEDDTSPQKVAEKILQNKDSITDEQRAAAAELKGKGNKHYAKREWKDAITLYTEAIEQNPADETFYSNRSACHMALKQHEDALYDALIAHTLKPEWIKGCYRISVALLALERFEDAAVSAFEGLSMDQENQELKALFQKCIKKGRREHEEQERRNKDDSGLKKETFFGSS